MSRPHRLAFLALTTVGLTFATTAATSARVLTYRPTLKINEAVAANLTDITFSQAAADDATARTIIFFPSTGFLITLNQAPGVQVGTLDGSAQAGDFGNATVRVDGTVTADNPSQFAAAAQACTGTVNHAALWLLNLSAGGQSFPEPVPVYIDLGTLQFCLPDPAHAPFKIKLLEATLRISGVIGLPGEPGDYRWTALNIPYAGTTPDLPGAIETQAIDSLPIDARLTGRLLTRTIGKGRHTEHIYSAKLTGHLAAGGIPVRGATVNVMVGHKKVASGFTRADGNFSKTLKLTRTTTYYANYTLASTGSPKDTTCQPLIAFQGNFFPCGTITRAGFQKNSKATKVTKPK